MSTQLPGITRWPDRIGEIDRRSLLPLLGAGAAFLMLARSAQMFPATVDSSWIAAAVLLPAARKSGSSLAARSLIERRQVCANGSGGHLSTHLR